MESLWYWSGKAFPIRRSVCSTSRTHYASNGRWLSQCNQRKSVEAKKEAFGEHERAYNWCKSPLWMFCTGLYHGKHSIHFQIWSCTLISTTEWKCLRQGKERLCCKICFSRCSSKNISSYVAFILLNTQQRAPGKWDGLSVRHIPLALAFPRKSTSIWRDNLSSEKELAQVEKDMRTARNPANERQFSCTEWLTKTQIKGFFSRLAALRRTGLTWYVSGNRRRCRMSCKRYRATGITWRNRGWSWAEASITFDVYDHCEYYHQSKLSAFNVQMLKNILSHLEVPFKSKEKKSILISKLREVIEACNCDATLYD